MNIISGLYNESEVKIGIVASRFNEIITSKLIDGVADGLSRHGVNLDTVDLAWVPGAFEVPVTAKKWRKAESMMPSFVWELSSVARQIIMSM